MENLVHHLRAKARRLHSRVEQRDPESVGRVRSLPELATFDDERVASSIQRRHCLAVIARELGFDGWPHARSILTGQASHDFGRCPDAT